MRLSIKYVSLLSVHSWEDVGDKVKGGYGGVQTSALRIHQKASAEMSCCPTHWEQNKEAVKCFLENWVLWEQISVYHKANEANTYSIIQTWPNGLL